MYAGIICTVKVISITYDIYAELKALKGDKSFPAILEELLNNQKGNPQILDNCIGILSEEEANTIENDTSNNRKRSMNRN
ncbi:antitoxin VapB family protein [Ferroplasma acidiphilum]|uniref:antitoxin VapB family protein n=1 Tax=Ferroplasma acidiphilum TaxID=74969 RepID=UPI0009C0F1A5